MDTKEQIKEAIASLCNFVNRVCKEGAASEEVAVLPEAVKALASLTSLSYLD